MRMDLIRVFEASTPDDMRIMQAWMNRLDSLEKLMKRYNLITLHGLKVDGKDLGEELERNWKTWILVPGAVRVLSKADPVSAFAGRSAGDGSSGNNNTEVEAL